MFAEMNVFHCTTKRFIFSECHCAD